MYGFGTLSIKSSWYTLDSALREMKGKTNLSGGCSDKRNQEGRKVRNKQISGQENVPESLKKIQNKKGERKLFHSTLKGSNLGRNKNGARIITSCKIHMDQIYVDGVQLEY